MENTKNKEKRYDRNVSEQNEDNVIHLPEDNRNRLDRREGNVKSEYNRGERPLESNVKQRYEEEE
ncbi:hypothetical protein UMM65_07060 [Aureibaculum sp. 2210JD6-5]|uniref:hypothetical protein n=1 Tax=Aureibaculum sp. 2210JD6-5 TaxID=3103957 RepID=UPI002AACB5D3|nr:hypothetical protein [Aureibaculum sp. 2210JD6-5]MDY7394995.1 hypothetical protein [Aureibaculum sp. 2210JD6-5]